MSKINFTYVIYTYVTFASDRRQAFRSDSVRLRFEVHIFSAKHEMRRQASYNMRRYHVPAFFFVFLSRLVAHIYSLKHLYAMYTYTHTHTYINTGQRWLVSQLVNLFWIPISLRFFPTFISLRSVFFFFDH